MTPDNNYSILYILTCTVQGSIESPIQLAVN